MRIRICFGFRASSFVFLGLALFCTALLGAQYFRPHGATIIVTNTDDNGPGSLRQAIADANDNDTIQFDPPLNGQTITLTSAELVIDKSITITGPGPALLSVSRNQQAPNFRIFHITPNHNVAISGLTISSGQLQSEGGGGIYNEGTLSVVNTTVTGNSTTGQASGGGAISNQGSLTIIQSTISGNSDDDQGGGILNSGMLTISDSSVSDNHSMGLGHYGGDGGGIYNSGTVTIQSTTISGNMALGADSTRGGGGIFNSGSLTATNSTIRGNTAINGGGIFGGATIVNCTVSNNTAWIFGNAIQGSGTIANSTISGNTAIQGGGIGVLGGFIITNSTISDNGGYNIFTVTAVELGHTILKASSSGVNVGTNGGSVTSHGYNLSSDNGGGFLTGAGDQINTEPLLGPLQDNGGPTFTHDLLKGSPAINQGDPNFTPPPSTDQRGYPRVANGRIDIGSVEVQSVPTPTPTPTLIVTNTNDSGPGSLRQALADAQDGDVIGFDPALNGQTITLTTAELVINKSITINGPGANMLTVARSTATGTPQFRVFHILPNHTVAIKNLTISNGVTGSGGGVANDQATLDIDYCTVTNNLASIGGGIENTGTLEISHSLITSNTATYVGGGISNETAGLLTITDSTVNNNSSTDFHDSVGGGIYHGSSQTLTIRNSHIDGNHANADEAAGGGGGIWSNGPMEIIDSTLNGNIAVSDGGGIYQRGGPTTITRSTISQNGTVYTGGGICKINSSNLTIIDSTFSGNNAGLNTFTLGWGGGIYQGGGTLTILNSTFKDNRAESGGSGGSQGAGIYCGGNVSISNSTFSGNFARINGGAIFNRSNPLTITNCTFSNNTSNGSAGGIISGGNNVVLQFGNTILRAGASGANIFSSGGGTITSLGYNLSSDNGGGFLNGPGDQINTDPILGPLQDNGGPTFTHLLLKGSPAINMGDPNFTPPPSTDQRGYPRVFNGRIDIGSVEIQPAPTPTPTATATVTATPTATATTTPIPTPTATPPPSTIQALNISTRLLVETGDNVGIGGFIISGADNLRVVIRGIGPSLGQLGIPDFLPDPTLQLRDGSGALIIANDNWQDDQNQAGQLMKLGLAPNNQLESGIVETLAPGAYTAVLSGKDGGIGVGLVEAYNVEQSIPLANIELGNISTRGFVQTGNDVMIGGFILGSGTPNTGIIVRGIGPSLTQYGIPDALADPTLELRDNNGALLVANNNWQDDPASAAQLTAHGLAPQNPLEAGIYAELQPGLYTGILAGQESGTGVGLVEIYNVH